MFEIDKTFFLEYGHRVHAQELREEFCATGDTKCACRHLHGHSGCVRIFLEGETLDHKGMVIDFKELGFMKDFIDDHLDHKMIIDINDPGFDYLVGGNIGFSNTEEYKINNELVSFAKPSTLTLFNGDVEATLVPVKVEDTVAGYVIDTTSIKGYVTDAAFEILEGYFFVDFLPTSEALCQFIHKLAQAKLAPIGVKVSKVEWNETPKSRAVYKSK